MKRESPPIADNAGARARRIAPARPASLRPENRRDTVFVDMIPGRFFYFYKF